MYIYIYNIHKYIYIYIYIYRYIHIIIPVHTFSHTLHQRPSPGDPSVSEFSGGPPVIRMAQYPFVSEVHK